MKVFRQILAATLFATFSLTGRAVEDPSSAITPILQHILERAKMEGQNDLAIRQLYGYTREKITEIRNGSGKVIKREVKNDARQPKGIPTIQSLPAVQTVNAGAAKDKAPGETNMPAALAGQNFNKNELMNEDVIKRFEFSLAGQEQLNGREMFIIDMTPKKNLEDHTFKDHFINKFAGRVWVDTTDYALVKANLHLTKPVDIAFGLVGSVAKINYAFERLRTDDGLWFTHETDIHVEGREGLVNRVFDQHESKTNLVKASSIAAR